METLRCAVYGCFRPATATGVCDLCVAEGRRPEGTFRVSEPVYRERTEEPPAVESPSPQRPSEPLHRPAVVAPPARGRGRPRTVQPDRSALLRAKRAILAADLCAEDDDLLPYLVILLLAVVLGTTDAERLCEATGYNRRLTRDAVRRLRENGIFVGHKVAMEVPPSEDASANQGQAFAVEFLLMALVAKGEVVRVAQAEKSSAD